MGERSEECYQPTAGWSYFRSDAVKRVKTSRRQRVLSLRSPISDSTRESKILLARLQLAGLTLPRNSKSADLATPERFQKLGNTCSGRGSVMSLERALESADRPRDDSTAGQIEYARRLRYLSVYATAEGQRCSASPRSLVNLLAHRDSPTTLGLHIARLESRDVCNQHLTSRETICQWQS
jgi:hypothetical protein